MPDNDSAYPSTGSLLSAARHPSLIISSSPLAPCLTQVAEFEWSEDLYINPTLPEETEKFLCEVVSYRCEGGKGGGI